MNQDLSILSLALALAPLYLPWPNRRRDAESPADAKGPRRELTAHGLAKPVLKSSSGRSRATMATSRPRLVSSVAIVRPYTGVRIPINRDARHGDFFLHACMHGRAAGDLRQPYSYAWRQNAKPDRQTAVRDAPRSTADSLGFLADAEQARCREGRAANWGHVPPAPRTRASYILRCMYWFG